MNINVTVNHVQDNLNVLVFLADKFDSHSYVIPCTADGNVTLPVLLNVINDIYERLSYDRYEVFADGYNDGFEDGYNSGFEDGYYDRYEELEKGYNSGFEDGYTENGGDEA